MYQQRKIYFGIIFIIMMSLCACSNSKKKYDGINMENSETFAEKQVEIQEETSESGDNSTIDDSLKTIDNHTKIYKGDYVTELDFAPADEKVALCKVRLGSEYSIGGSMIGSDGIDQHVQTVSIPNVGDLSSERMKGSRLYDIVLTNNFDKGKDKFTFEVTTNENFYPENVENLYPNGIVKGQGTDHPAYFTRDGGKENAMVYQLQKGKILIMTYEGDLTSQLSAEEFAEDFYQIVIVN